MGTHAPKWRKHWHLTGNHAPKTGPAHGILSKVPPLGVLTSARVASASTHRVQRGDKASQEGVEVVFSPFGTGALMQPETLPGGAQLASPRFIPKRHFQSAQRADPARISHRKAASVLGRVLFQHCRLESAFAPLIHWGMSTNRSTAYVSKSL